MRSITPFPRPTHDAAYWADKTKEFDFSIEDHIGNVPKFNRIVWEGLKGSVPYPSQRNGVDLRQNRKGTKEIADSRSLVAKRSLTFSSASLCARPHPPAEGGDAGGAMTQSRFERSLREKCGPMVKAPGREGLRRLPR